VSREPVTWPQSDCPSAGQSAVRADLRLDCNTGFGTATFVTGAFGFAAASRIVQQIASGVAESPVLTTQK